MSYESEWFYRDKLVRNVEYQVLSLQKALDEAKKALESARAFRKEWEDREENYND